jgi:hypothetical protein
VFGNLHSRSHKVCHVNGRNPTHLILKLHIRGPIWHGSIGPTGACFKFMLKYLLVLSLVLNRINSFRVRLTSGTRRDHDSIFRRNLAYLHDFSSRGDSNVNSDLLGITSLLQKNADARKEKKPTSSKKKKPSSSTTFTRTNRVDGMRVWIKELQILQGGDQSSALILLVELAKELLYSGIPEQVMELHAAYYDIMRNSNCTVELGIADLKLFLVTIRAFLSLKDVEGAMRLYYQCRSADQHFDFDSKSIIIKELAVTSSEGLKAALQLWEEESLLLQGNGEAAGGKVMSVGAYCGLLQGITEHGLARRRRGSALLVERGQEEGFLAEEIGALWRMATSTAEEVSTRLVREYLAGVGGDDNGKGSGKANQKVLQEYLRLSFRLGSSSAKLKLNRNFEVDGLSDQQERAKEGLRHALQMMQDYHIEWNLPVADTLVDECLRCGDVASVEFVVEQMRCRNVVSRTSTFNTLLRQYSNTYDGESAFYLLQSMTTDPQTKPNIESYRLVLQACSRSTRCKFFSDTILSQLRADDKMFKEAWDRYVEQQAVDNAMETSRNDNEAIGAALHQMVQSGSQPDDDTIVMLLDAHKRTGSIQKCVQLYRLQATSEIQRRWYRQSLDAASNVTVVDFNYNNRKIDMHVPRQKDDAADDIVSNYALYLPPPSVTTVCHLLEILRDVGDYKTANEVVSDMLERSILSKKNVPVITQSGKKGVSVVSLALGVSSAADDLLSKLYRPDRSAFVLAIEACLSGVDTTAGGEEDLASRARVALELFSKMEAAGISPDRRCYAALIKVFGLLQNDVASALGVFEEMRRKYVPDVENLQSLLQVCSRNPMDLRTMCEVLDEMATEEQSPVHLEAFSNDILMQLFPDALALGRVLEAMERQPVPKGTEIVYSGISVLSVMAQALRETQGIESVMKTMLFLGRCGIRPDPETMEYFRPQQAPERFSPNSKDHFKLQPHKLKQRSLMDITIPLDMHEGELKLPDRGFQRSERSIKADRVPYFESNNQAWSQHEKAITNAMKSDWEIYEDSDFNRIDNHLPVPQLPPGTTSELISATATEKSRQMREVYASTARRDKEGMVGEPEVFMQQAKTDRRSARKR